MPKAKDEQREAEIVRFINKHYANSEAPMRQREIAKVFGVKETIISKLVVKYGLQKKHDFVKRVVKRGIPERTNRPKQKITLSKEERARRKRLGCEDCVNYRKCMFMDCPFE